MNKFGKVALLLGGNSAEREVSLKSGTAVLAALQRQGVDAHAFDPAQRNLSELATFDRVFNALHGRGGEDGTIQGALELMGIPYTGSGVMASSLGMDKWRTKLLWRALNVMTPDFEVVTADSDFAAIEKKLGLPLFVKPANEGSSIGITKVKQTGGLEAAYLLAAKADPLVIAEAFVSFNSEITLLTVTQKNGATLFCPPIGHRQERGDYQESWQPCAISEKDILEAQDMAAKVTKALTGSGLCLVFRNRKNVRYEWLQFLELLNLVCVSQ